MYPQNRNQIAYLFNEWVFGRICNPPELSISIFNALLGLKMALTSVADRWFLIFTASMYQS